MTLSTRLSVMSIGVSLLVLAGAAAALADEVVTADYRFERPDVSTVRIGADVYDRVTIPACSNGGQVGEPALPRARSTNPAAKRRRRLQHPRDLR